MLLQHSLCMMTSCLVWIVRKNQLITFPCRQVHEHPCVSYVTGQTACCVPFRWAQQPLTHTSPCYCICSPPISHIKDLSQKRYCLTRKKGKLYGNFWILESVVVIMPLVTLMMSCACKRDKRHTAESKEAIVVWSCLHYNLWLFWAVTQSEHISMILISFIKFMVNYTFWSYFIGSEGLPIAYFSY